MNFSFHFEKSPPYFRKYQEKKLGESWSTPRIMRIKVNGTDRWVAVFGAGYNSKVAPEYGSAIFIVDLENEGKVLKRIDIKDNQIYSFKEKPVGDGARINGGFFVMEPKFLNYIKSDSTYLEREPLEKISKIKQNDQNKCLTYVATNETIKSIEARGYSEDCPPLSGTIYGDIAKMVSSSFE